VSILALPSYVQRLPKKARLPLQTCIYGLCAGAVTVAFQVGMSRLYKITFLKLSHQSTTMFLIGTFAVLVSTSLIVGWLLNSFCREASGSGIPQLKVAFWRDFGFVSWRVVWVKFVAGILSIGGGSSLGREGPSVQLAGGLGSKLGGILGEPKQNRRIAAASGAAAGLAAAFNTPLASVTFVLEEIIQDLNSRMLGSVLFAAVIGALVVHGLLGPQPAFTLGDVEAPSWIVYVITPFVAAFASLSGMAFQKTTLGLRARRKNFHRIPGWMRPGLGALITWGLGVAVFLTTHRLGVFSLGYEDLSDALNGHLAWQLAALLLVTKLIATFTCYGFGGCGGVFSPTLFFGAMSGVVVAGLFNLVVPLHTSDIVALAVVGMSACLGAVVRAPVTGILIVFEMTHEFSLVPLLMLGSLISQAVSYKLSKESFYDGILAQDDIHIEHIVPPRDLQSWQQLPTSAIARFQPVIITNLEPNQLQKFLKEYSFERFPVVLNGKLAGVLMRREAELALAEKRAPHLEPAVCCLPRKSIKDLQFSLMESRSGLVVLQDQEGGNIIGLVTLHDLLRAEVSIAERSGD
jgi:chloride channel protein, CIC family